MNRLKIDYGIDLGTTNSAIARIENGEPVIKKTRSPQVDTLPSCVYFAKSRRGISIKVGLNAKTALASDSIEALKQAENGVSKETFGYIEFKREMGNTNASYSNSRMDKHAYTPIELSAEVLKELRSQINDENVDSIVITVPAKFDVISITSTKEAAHLAGFKQCEILQEPIAAALAYGLSSQQENAHWVVFDFGGGTFDAALITVQDGIMTVIDTEGDNFLGGKNLDADVIETLLLPILREQNDIESYFEEDWKMDYLRNGLKGIAEEIRIQLSFEDSYDFSTYDRDMDLGSGDDGEAIELDVTISKEELAQAITPHYQKAVDITKDLLKRNNISGKDLTSVILVGGPTYSPIVRNMLKTQITEKVDTNLDPMTVVAKGAALYAATIDKKNVTVNPESNEYVELEIDYNATSKLPEEFVTIKLTDKKYESVYVEMVRHDNAWRSDKIEINSIGDVIEVSLIPNKVTSFAIHAYDNVMNELPLRYQNITISPIDVPSAPLPYFISVESWSNNRNTGVMTPLEGMEKNKSLPAVGINKKPLKIQKDIRPGMAEDEIRIPIYQSDADSENKPAFLYQHVATAVINGDEVGELIPSGTKVELTLKADKSQMMTMSVYFPAYDITIEKELDTTGAEIKDEHDINYYFEYADDHINDLKKANVDTAEVEKEYELVQNERNSGTTDGLKIHIKQVLRRIVQLEDDNEWKIIEHELRAEFEELERAQEDLGDDETAAIISALRPEVDKVIKRGNAKDNIEIAREIKKNVVSINWRITMLPRCIGLIHSANKQFNNVEWKDSVRARRLITNGLEIINNNPTVDRLQPIAAELVGLIKRGDIGGEDLLG